MKCFNFALLTFFVCTVGLSTAQAQSPVCNPAACHKMAAKDAKASAVVQVASLEETAPAVERSCKPQCAKMAAVAGLTDSEANVEAVTAVKTVKVALSTDGKNCDPKNCDPSQCDPKNCDITQCNPANCKLLKNSAKAEL